MFVCRKGLVDLVDVFGYSLIQLFDTAVYSVFVVDDLRGESKVFAVSVFTTLLAIDHAFLNIRQCIDQVFEFFRIDILSVLQDDDVLLPAAYEDEAVFVDGCEISCMEPAIYKNGIGRLLVFVITEHYVCSSRYELADSLFVLISKHEVHVRHRETY